MRVLVIGDLILDIERLGRSSRKSPEDPHCLVLYGVKERASLGGAANVALWLASQPELSVTLMGHYAYDSVGTTLIELCRKYRIELSPHLRRFDGGYCTTVKERVCLQGEEGQKLRQLARIDRETPLPLTDLDYKNITEAIERNNYDLILAVDYAKGAFLGIWGEKLQDYLGDLKNSLTVVNSKVPGDWTTIPVDVLICNAQEGSNLWGSNDSGYPPIEASSLVITRSESGVCAYTRQRTYSCETLAEEVVDVTGAGDAFTAGFAARLLELNSKNGCERDRLLECLEQGQLWAANCLKQPGCGKPRWTR